MLGKKIAPNKYEIITTEEATRICLALREKGWSPTRRGNIIYIHLDIDMMGWLDDAEDKRRNAAIDKMYIRGGSRGGPGEYGISNRGSHISGNHHL